MTAPGSDFVNEMPQPACLLQLHERQGAIDRIDPASAELMKSIAFIGGVGVVLYVCIVIRKFYV